MKPTSSQKCVLLVDCDPVVGALIKRGCEKLAAVEVITSFPVAKRRLAQDVADLLVTNLRLNEYNGLHLVYLASTRTPVLTRSVVYSAFPDPLLIDEAQAAGAMYERLATLAASLPAYLKSALPPRDQRSPLAGDRRQLFRGGRRASDPVLVAAS